MTGLEEQGRLSITYPSSAIIIVNSPHLEYHREAREMLHILNTSLPATHLAALEHALVPGDLRQNYIIPLYDLSQFQI